MLWLTITAGVETCQEAVHCLSQTPYDSIFSGFIMQQSEGSKLLCIQGRLWCAGNVATEDVVYMLDGLGISHGVDMNKLLDINEFISAALKKPNSSRAARALLAARAC